MAKTAWIKIPPGAPRNEQGTTPLWNALSDPSEILDTPVEQLYFFDKDTAEREINIIITQSHGLPLSLSDDLAWAISNTKETTVWERDTPHFKYDKAGLSLLAYKSARCPEETVALEQQIHQIMPKVQEALKYVKKINILYPLSCHPEIIERYGVYNTEHTMFTMDPEIIKNFKKERQAYRKQLEEREKKPRHIYNNDISGLQGRLAQVILDKEVLYLDPYGRRRKEMQNHILMLKDLWNWTFGMHSYRQLKEMQKFKKLWQEQTEDSIKKGRFTESFIAFMKNELNAKSYPKPRLMKRSAFYHDQN